VHERALAERATAELLRRIEKSLAHSRDAQINEVLARRYGRFPVLNLSGMEKASKWVN